MALIKEQQQELERLQAELNAMKQERLDAKASKREFDDDDGRMYFKDSVRKAKKHESKLFSLLFHDMHTEEKFLQYRTGYLFRILLSLMSWVVFVTFLILTTSLRFNTVEAINDFNTVTIPLNHRLFRSPVSYTTPPKVATKLFQSDIHDKRPDLLSFSSTTRGLGWRTS